jgi:hypothetical protein
MGTRWLRATLLAGALVLGLSACTGDTPNDSPTTGAGPSKTRTSASPTPSRSPYPTAPATDPAVVFAADGIGGYLIGAGLTDLQSRAMVTNIVPNQLCLDTRQADATGVYAGRLSLTFRAGQLIAIRTTVPDFVTPSGARVGMALADLRSTYGGRGTLIAGKALSVRVPATTLALLFTIDPASSTVTGLAAGQAQALEDAVGSGQLC